MTPLLVTAVLVAVAVAVAAVLQRRPGHNAPAQGEAWNVPAQLHRPDFDRPDARWLVVVFSSETCTTCAGTWAKVEPLASVEVAVQDVSFQAHPDLHRRYGIDAVPTVVVADDEGVVCASFLGQPTAGELWAAVADVRAPGPDD